MAQEALLIHIMKYSVIMHGEYHKVHLHTVLRIKPGLFAQLRSCSAQNRGWADEERMNPLKTRIWGYCATLLPSSSCCSLCAGMAAAPLCAVYWDTAAIGSE